MLTLKQDFFKPTKELRSLAIMEALAADSALSQQDLGERSAMSSAMVNQYLREMQTSHMVDFIPVNGKSYRYNLTDAGAERRRALFGAYCAEVVRAYSALKRMVREKLAPLEQKGLTRLALFGASETCEVVLSALLHSPFRILALVDSDPDKHGQTFHGHVVSPPTALANLDCQAVLITSFGRQDEIYRQLTANNPQSGWEIVRL